jgi:hypothetical protein
MGRVFLHHGFDLVETIPGEALGKCDGSGRLFRLRAIPYFYSKPTYGDVICARREPEFHGNWAWEVPRQGGAKVTDLHHDGGRYAMIMKYEPSGQPRPDGWQAQWFPEGFNVISEIAASPRDSHPGRLYLAVPPGMTHRKVLGVLRQRHPEYTFTQVHPKPRKPAPAGDRTR